MKALLRLDIEYNSLGNFGGKHGRKLEDVMNMHGGTQYPLSIPCVPQNTWFVTPTNFLRKYVGTVSIRVILSLIMFLH